MEAGRVKPACGEPSGIGPDRPAFGCADRAKVGMNWRSRPLGVLVTLIGRLRGICHRFPRGGSHLPVFATPGKPRRRAAVLSDATRKRKRCLGQNKKRPRAELRPGLVRVSTDPGERSPVEAPGVATVSQCGRMILAVTNQREPSQGRGKREPRKRKGIKSVAD
jgi:hypothetical protein